MKIKECNRLSAVSCTPTLFMLEVLYVVASHASQPFLEWLPLSEYNPTDISTRRIVGFVKPVSYVHKFKVRRCYTIM